jgi:hypothetical protein
MTHAEQDETDENPKHQNQDLTRKCSPSARSIKSVSPDGLGKESAIKTQLGLIKQTTGKDVKVEAVIDFTLLRQVLAEAK